LFNMLRQGLLLIARHCPRFSPRLLSSNTVYFDANEYATALYHKLSEKEQYKFLDRSQPPSALVTKDQALAASTAFADFLNILSKQEQGEGQVEAEEQMKHIQKEFSELFTKWSKLSQLSVGFMMYLDSRIEADSYLIKVIKHLGSGNLYDASPHDLTALMLLIYFKRDLSVEDVSEFMDVETLMTVLSQHLRNGKMSRDEVTACCLGLKRLQGLVVNHAFLRKELYRQLEGFTPQSNSLDDFFVVTLMTTLSRGNLIFKDNIDQVTRTVQILLGNFGNVGLETAIKIFTFPLTLNVFHSERLEESLIERAKKEEEHLDSKDLIALANYFSKSPSKDYESTTLDWLSSVLERRLKQVTKLDGLADIIDCFHYLSHKKVYNQYVIDVLFKSMQNVSNEEGFDVKNASVRLAESLASNLNLDLEDKDSVSSSMNSSKRMTALFSRVPAFLIQSWSLDTGEASRVPGSLLANLSKASHRTLPMQLYSPAMDLRNLDLRMKQLVTCYRSLAKFLGSEEYCRVTRLLPHFDEPDIVFGNIGGNTLTVPDNLWQQDVDGPRPAPPGDWHVLVMGTRKSLDREGRVVGQDLAKLSQLKSLGYTPLIVPINVLGSPGQISTALKKLLRTTDVTLPNIDDGAIEKGLGRR